MHFCFCAFVLLCICAFVHGGKSGSTMTYLEGWPSPKTIISLFRHHVHQWVIIMDLQKKLFKAQKTLNMSVPFAFSIKWKLTMQCNDKGVWISPQ